MPSPAFFCFRPSTCRLLPKDATGVASFLASHADKDGRGVTIAVLDTGVDPGAAGLRCTSDGRVKVVDIIDCTSSGDVAVSGRGVLSADGHRMTGITGRQLTLTDEMLALAARGAAAPADGSAPAAGAGEWRLGVASAARLFPKPLATRITAERTAGWATVQREKLTDISRRKAAHAAKAAPSGAGADAKAHKLLTEELAAAEELLTQAERPTSAAVYDVVVFWDGVHWRVVVDTSEVGDLSACLVLENYRVAQRFASFGDRERIHFGVNVYNDGNVVSLVVESGYHGTHVAGIAAGNYPDAPERNGVAPGAQIVSLKIGDSRLGGMETHQGLVRALNHLLPASLEDPSTPPHAAQHKVTAQVANMSYGEPTAFPNEGRVVQLLTALARDAGVLFLSSAGNAGPGLSTLGSPGGTTDAVIGVGAYVTPGLATQAYSLLPDGLVYPSPGAMSADGYPPAEEGLMSGGGGRDTPTTAPASPRVKAEPTATVAAAATSAADVVADGDAPLGVPYTFTARGPCPDGSLGVTISAPGGAVASSSSWTLRKKQLLNGTSMSCPSVAGAVAVTLSARPNISVARLRRAIENGASSGLRPAFFEAVAGGGRANAAPAAANGTGATVGNGVGQAGMAASSSGTPTSGGGDSVDALTTSELALSVGRGSYSVPRTVAYLDAYADCPEEDWRFAVSVTPSSTPAKAVILARGSPREFGRRRGVYLRGGGAECRTACKWVVHMDVANDALPDRSAAAAQMASELELDVSLVTSAPWISAPAGVRLYGGGRQFPITVDPSGLTPGKMHYGEVAGYVAPPAGDGARGAAAPAAGGWAEPRGPLFRVPVTVVKPLMQEGGDGGVCSLEVERISLSPGGVVRTFVLPPGSATFARVQLSAGTAEEFLGSAAAATVDGVGATRTLQLHTVQVVQGLAPGGPRQVFVLSPDGVASTIVPVQGGVTLELALAQLWSSAGACTLRRLEVTFSGLSLLSGSLSMGAGAVASPVVVLANRLPQGGPACRLSLDASDPSAYAAAAEAAEQGTTCRATAAEAPPVLAGVGVKATLNLASRVLPPSLAVITALPRDRDLLPDARCVYQLELEYSLSLSSSDGSNNTAVQVSPRFSGLHHAPYNAEIEGGPYILIFDANGKCVHTTDIYPSFVGLSVKGTYTIRVFVRHERVNILQALTDMCVTLRMKLGSPLTLETHRTPHAAALALVANAGVNGQMGIGPTGRATLAPGATQSFCFAPPRKAALPKWLETGDKLSGSMTIDRVLAPDGPTKAGTTSQAGLSTYDVSWVVSPTMSGEKSAKTERSPDKAADKAGVNKAVTNKTDTNKADADQVDADKDDADKADAVKADAVKSDVVKTDSSADDGRSKVSEALEEGVAASGADRKDKDKVSSWVASQMADARVSLLKKIIKDAASADLSDAPTHVARFVAVAAPHLEEKADDTAVLLLRLQLEDSVAQRRVAAVAAAALGVSSLDAAASAPLARGGDGEEDTAKPKVDAALPAEAAAGGGDLPDWAAVIAAADAVVANIDARALAAHFGMHVNTEDEEAVAENKRRETTKSTLIEALFRKARAAAAVATASMVAAVGSSVAPPLFNEGGDAPSAAAAADDVAAVEAAIAALSAWAAVTPPPPFPRPTANSLAATGGVACDKPHVTVSGASVADVALLVSARERLRGRPAVALRALSGLAPPSVGGRALAKTVVERFALLSALGWTAAEADARADAAVAFPKFGERY